MGLLFWGFLFTSFDYILNIRSLHVGIAPDFLGYMFFVAGCKALFQKSRQFEKVYKLVSIAMFVAAAKYVCDLFGVLLFVPAAARIPVEICYAAMKLLVAVSVIKAYKEMEETTRIDLRTKKLFNTSVVLFVFLVLKAVGPLGTIGSYIYIVAFFGTLFAPALLMVHEYDAYMNYKGAVLLK